MQYPLLFVSTLSALVIAECPLGHVKRDILAEASDSFDGTWAKIMAEAGTAASWGNPLGDAAALLFESMKPTVEALTDVMPGGRKKRIHSVGVVAQAKYVPVANSQNYSGIFATGSDYALIRLSTATQPPQDKDAIVPGAAIKMFRDGLPSANFPFMYSLQGQQSNNFFENEFSNHVTTKDQPQPLPVIAKKFATVSAWPGIVGLSDVAKYTQDGQVVESINFPFQIIAKPALGLSTRPQNKGRNDLLDEIIQNVPEGSDIWDIYASPAPKEPFERIGKITTTSLMIKSTYADSQLFFRHQIFEEDLALRPDWLKSCPSMDECPACQVEHTCTFV